MIEVDIVDFGLMMLRANVDRRFPAQDVAVAEPRTEMDAGGSYRDHLAAGAEQASGPGVGILHRASNLGESRNEQIAEIVPLKSAPIARAAIRLGATKPVGEQC